MDLFWYILTGLLCYGAGVGTAWLLWRKREPEPIEFERRPIEPRDDAILVTRDPGSSKGHSRVSTAHVSQPRPYWNR
jgi:hypothetical protein